MTDEPSRWLDSNLPDDLRAVLTSAREDDAGPAQLASLRAGVEKTLGAAAFGLPPAGATRAAGSGDVGRFARRLFASKSSIAAWTAAAIVALGAATFGMRTVLQKTASPMKLATASKQLPATTADDSESERVATEPSSANQAGVADPRERGVRDAKPDARQPEARQPRPDVHEGQVREAEPRQPKTEPRTPQASEPEPRQPKTDPRTAQTPEPESNARAHSASRLGTRPEALPASASGAAQTALAKELASLDRIRAEMRTPARALTDLRRHAAAFPQGALVAERELLQLEALLRAGRVAEAKQLATRMTNGPAHYPYQAQALQLMADYGLNR